MQFELSYLFFYWAINIQFLLPAKTFFFHLSSQIRKKKNIRKMINRISFSHLPLRASVSTTRFTKTDQIKKEHEHTFFFLKQMIYAQICLQVKGRLYSVLLSMFLEVCRLQTLILKHNLNLQ